MNIKDSKLEAEAFKKQLEKLYVPWQTSQAMTRSDLSELMKEVQWSLLLSESLQRASVRVHTRHGRKPHQQFH